MLTAANATRFVVTAARVRDAKCAGVATAVCEMVGGAA